jgi:hypothetical protein
MVHGRSDLEPEPRFRYTNIVGSELNVEVLRASAIVIATDKQTRRQYDGKNLSHAHIDLR